MAFVAWTEIELFHNVRRMFVARTDLTPSRISYRAKIKLHGTNAAIQKTSPTTLEAQSRSQILTLENDNAGFARWVEQHKESFLRTLPLHCIVFGEWCGPGIMKSVAINKIPQKIFAVFAALHLETQELVLEPEALKALVPSENAYVLPWFPQADCTFDWRDDNDVLESTIQRVNECVAEVERLDPWVRDTFGIQGTGEGLVFYPQGFRLLDEITMRMWKAKGEAHRVVKAPAAVQLDPTVVRSLESFAELVLPTARLEQGAHATRPDGAQFVFDLKRMGAFLAWVQRDVEKETKAELAASGLDPKQAARAVTERARRWYLENATREV